MLPYMDLATNNYQEIISDCNGAYCVYCLQKPIITEDSIIEITDISTVICPLCNVDAIVPASKVENFKQLALWHELGFGLDSLKKQLESILYSIKKNNLINVCI